MKIPRDKLEKEKRHGDQLKRWKDQIINGPDNLKTEVSDSYDPLEDDVVPEEECQARLVS